uniref:Uncharacterized protein n=1 Tax=Nelumbo nucifera TaxID=4432 RepID=A0A822YQA7_NELNU|nr:TPA_asm: hypothetical protein HUJ06_011847 [Nelumbo nucifera]
MTFVASSVEKFPSKCESIKKCRTPLCRDGVVACLVIVSETSVYMLRVQLGFFFSLFMFVFCGLSLLLAERMEVFVCVESIHLFDHSVISSKAEEGWSRRTNRKD